MKWFLNMRISLKLISTFVVVAIIAGIVGIVAIDNIKTIDENGHTIYANMTVPLLKRLKWQNYSNVFGLIPGI